MTEGLPAPLIVTAMLDPASQARFDRLREHYFPSSINVLAAHVTLFHHLPGTHRNEVETLLAETCRTRAPCPFAVTGLRFLGRGTAYALHMPEVSALRQQLATTWAPWLTAQDRQAWRPHVTVQNKVTPAEARQTHTHLSESISPADGVVLGLQLWAYLGGPWERLAETEFQGASQD